MYETICPRALAVKRSVRNCACPVTGARPLGTFRGVTKELRTMNDGRSEPEGIAAAVKQLSQDIAVLVRSELELARTEMAEKAKRAGVGAGMLSGSAVTGLLTLGSFTALLILAIALVLPAWLSALIVTVMWAAVTAILAFAGKNKIQDAGPLVPEQTIESVKEDVEWAKSGLKSGKR
jgi:Putative Actinobacterial Holin-X, holin superfamily III